MTRFGFGNKKAGPTPAAEPLSKQDYARTTSGSPDSTSLIPAIEEVLADEGGEPTEAIARIAPEPEPSAPPPVSPVVAPAAAASSRRRSEQRLIRVEPYSVTRLAFVVSVALMIVTTVAAAIFWLMLSITGVWGEINEAVASLLSDDSASFDITDYLGFTRVVGGTLVISGINVILMTALATVGAHLYNLAAALLGGVEITVSDD